MGLDERGWDRGVDRVADLRCWPIYVAQADAPERARDPLVEKAWKRVQALDDRATRAWAKALSGRCRHYLRRAGVQDDLEAALRLDPRLTPARLWLAEYLLGDRDLPRAEALARRAVKDHPGEAWPLAVHAACLFKRGQPQEALAALDLAVKKAPRRPWLRVLRGEILGAAMRSPESIAEHAAAAKLAPREVWAQLLLARAIYNGGGDKTRAGAALDRALKLAPDLFEARVMKAEALRRQGRFQPALREYRALEKIGVSPYPRLYAWRGSLLRQMGRLDEALKDLDRACAMSPEYSLPFVDRAHARLRRGNFSGAFEDMNAAARLDGKHGFYHRRPGEDDALAQVVSLLRRAAKTLPKSPWPAAWLGETYLRADRPPDALKALDRALALDPKCAWAWAWRGETLERLARKDAALKDFARSVKLDARYARAQGRLGVALAAAGRLKEALAALDASLALEATSAWALAHRGEVKLRLGRAKDALADLDRALNQHRDYADALLWRGMALGLLGRDGKPDIARAQALGKDRAAMARWLEALNFGV